MQYVPFIVASVLLYLVALFLISHHKKRLDIVDVAWGGAFIIIAISSLLLGNRGPLQYLTTAIVIIWGLRLSYYIAMRLRHSTSEDPRYKAMRKQWRGSIVLSAFFRIFMTQGLLALLVSVSVITINLSSTTDVGQWAIIGVLVWLTGFAFEAVGDAQLRAHLTDPAKKGMLMTSGLWRYTRHPNYFGEATQWWGIFIIALSIPLGWLSVIGPLTITILLLFISGIPLTERRFEGRAGWIEYKRRTSVFIPLPPKKIGQR